MPSASAGVLLAALATAAADRPAGLLRELDEIRQSAGVAGLGLVLVEPSQPPACFGLGLADRATGRPFDDETVVRIGSISKAFAGLALLSATESDLIDLDAPIVEAPELLFDNPFAEQPTLAMLLEHTAGLRDLSKAEWDHNVPVALQEALKVDPSSRRLAWPPGRHSVYSNSGAGVAAHVFELRTGRDFEAFVDDRVFAPLGMASATFRRAETDLEQLATGYDRDGRTVIPYWHQLYRPFGAINVRLCEMAQLIRLFLGRGLVDGNQVLPATAIERAQTPNTSLAAQAGIDYGYGFGVHAYSRDGHLWHGHGGDADGYVSFFGYSQQLNRGYFLVINAFQNGTLRSLRRLVERYLAGDAKATFAAPAPQPRGELTALTGHYEETARRFGGPPDEVDVVFAEGRLWIDTGDRRVHLLPLGERRFRRRHDPVATTVFVETDGRLFLQGPTGDFVRVEPAGEH